MNNNKVLLSIVEGSDDESISLNNVPEVGGPGYIKKAGSVALNNKFTYSTQNIRKHHTQVKNKGSTSSVVS